MVLADADDGDLLAVYDFHKAMAAVALKTQSFFEHRLGGTRDAQIIERTAVIVPLAPRAFDRVNRVSRLFLVSRHGNPLSQNDRIK